MGQVLGEIGELPDVFTELEINFFLLRRLLGVRTTVCTRLYCLRKLQVSTSVVRQLLFPETQGPRCAVPQPCYLSVKLAVLVLQPGIAFCMLRVGRSRAK